MGRCALWSAFHDALQLAFSIMSCLSYCIAAGVVHCAHIVGCVFNTHAIKVGNNEGQPLYAAATGWESGGSSCTFGLRQLAQSTEHHCRRCCAAHPARWLAVPQRVRAASIASLQEGSTQRELQAYLVLFVPALKAVEVQCSCSCSGCLICRLPFHLPSACVHRWCKRSLTVCTWQTCCTEGIVHTGLLVTSGVAG